MTIEKPLQSQADEDMKIGIKRGSGELEGASESSKKPRTSEVLVPPKAGLPAGPSSSAAVAESPAASEKPPPKPMPIKKKPKEVSLFIPKKKPSDLKVCYFVNNVIPNTYSSLAARTSRGRCATRGYET